MDGQRFDDLTRWLATGASRRGLLKGALAGLVAGVAGQGARRVAAAGQANGTPCSRSTDCASYRCVDGVCCNSGCTGQCEACNLPGLAGVCSPVSGQPVGHRTACPGTGPCKGSCDGVKRSACAAFPGAETSCGASTCSGGWQTTYACAGNGACAPRTTSCGLYFCNASGTACLTTCSGNGDCVGAAHCAGGICQGDKPLGQGCVGADQCQSGVCVDGVCCNTACSGVCQACNVPGNLGFCTEEANGTTCQGGTCCDGKCVNIQTSLQHCGGCNRACRLSPTAESCEMSPICVAGSCSFTPQPQGTVCRPSAGDCDVAEVCNGESLTCPPNAFRPNTFECRVAVGPCDVAEFCTGSSAACPADAFHPNTVECRAASCTAGVATPRATCPGNGAACPAEQTQNCAPYVCGPTACRTTCTDDTHCIASHHCDNGQCLPDVGLGEACDEDSNCQNGVCAQGVCCNRACAAPCNVCSAATGGVCTSVSCAMPGECEIGPGACNPLTAACEYPAAAGGSACGGEIGGRICCDRTCCDSGETCVGNTCQAACVALGATCQGEEECCQDGLTFCEGTCCHDLDETCVSDAQCCSGRCGDDGQCCSPPGSSCGDDGQCCRRELGVCDFSPSGRICRCSLVGEPCRTSGECCGLESCVNGACRAGACLSPQASCRSDFDCCFNGPTICEVDNFRCCRAAGGACATTGDCCAGSGTCQGGRCCFAQGTACSSDSICCPGMTCRGGSCQFPCPLGAFPCGATCCGNRQHCVNGTCQCVELGGTCDSANNLCCLDEETHCPEFNPFGNRNTCCRPQGGHCGSAADCCFEIYESSPFTRDTCGDDNICGGDGALCQTAADCVDGRSCIGLCFGKGLGFHLCSTNAQCPEDVDGNATSCRQKRCVYPNELPD
ncbi:MAG: hypothetical protein ACRDJW_14895 [Thermomicrobiales bacterium]